MEVGKELFFQGYTYYNMKYVLGNHWTSAPDGWTILKEEDQDMTARLKWDDNSVDVLYQEHVLEHLHLTDAILFFKEAKRVLKPGGILRTVCPMIDSLITFDENTTIGKHFAQVQLMHYFKAEEHALAELGIPMTDHGHEFLLDSLLKNHGHRHVWSTSLMVRVLEKIGFSRVTTPEIGKSFFDESNCLERIYRGVDVQFARDLGYYKYDPESAVVEAIK